MSTTNLTAADAQLIGDLAGDLLQRGHDRAADFLFAALEAEADDAQTA